MFFENFESLYVYDVNHFNVNVNIIEFYSDNNSSLFGLTLPTLSTPSYYILFHFHFSYGLFFLSVSTFYSQNIILYMNLTFDYLFVINHINDERQTQPPDGRHRSMDKMEKLNINNNLAHIKSSFRHKQNWLTFAKHKYDYISIDSITAMRIKHTITKVECIILSLNSKSLKYLCDLLRYFIMITNLDELPAYRGCSD